MTRKLLAFGLVAGMVGIAACEPREDPAFEDDFQFQEAPPATPAPAPIDTPRDPAMDPATDPTMDPERDPERDPAAPQPRN